MEDFKNTRDVMHYLFVKKTNDSIDSILEDTKKSLFNDIEYDYNPDIVIASVNTSYSTGIISESEFKYYNQVLNSIKDIRLNCKSEPAVKVQKRFNDLDLLMR